jgi:DNA-binding FadR family transcriptional regulator
LHSHFETAEVWSDAIAEHREILKALRSKNPDRARAAMQEHMGISFKRLSSSLTRTKRRQRATVRNSKASSLANKPGKPVVARKKARAVALKA